MDEVRSATHSAPYTELPVRFTGSGGDYFRIWIVNLLLTIVTVGIYSAWAKVRRLQYFYRHTELAGSSFDYHGDPVRILIGRIVALMMIGVYKYTAGMNPFLFLGVLAVLAAIMPWLLRNSLRFRLYNTSWRGTRFHFHGSVGGAYRVFLLNGFLTVITLYILAPFAHQRLKAYQHGNSAFGRTPFSFNARVGSFYLAYLLVLAGAIGFIIIGSIAGFSGAFGALVKAKAGGTMDPKAIFTAVAILWGTALLIGLAIGPIFQAVLTNLIWNNTQLGEHRLVSALSPWKLMWVGISNFVLVVVTIGFFRPWAMVRMARLQAEAVTLIATTDLTEFVAAEPETLGAVGEEAASFFDFDISL
jgi:uncharacterized membrane protein YjgN (DUF898 family)